MKVIKKISFIFLLICLVFMSVSNVFCAIDVRAVKTGDVIYFDNTDTKWEKVRVYFYSTWGGSEVVSWANSLEMTEVSDGIYALNIGSELNIEDHNVNMLVFNNGKEGNSNQSIDLGFIDSIYGYKLDGTENDGKNKGYWSVYDKSELETLYDDALTYEEPFYTVESYSELKKKVELSKSALENEIRLGQIEGEGAGFESEYPTVISDLKNAINNLVVNKDLLKNKINEVKNIDLTLYTQDTADEVTIALNTAEEKYNLSTLTVQDIKEQINLLDNAVSKLRANKILLVETLNLANEIINNDSKYYTKESIDAFEISITKGNDVVSNDLATPDEVRNAMVEINESINNLVFNKQLIKDLISKANSVEFDEYTEESVEILKNSIVNAETLLKEDSIPIPKYLQLEKEVNDAINSLVKKEISTQPDENLVEEPAEIEKSENPVTGTYMGILTIIMSVAIAMLVFTIIYNKNKIQKVN